MAKFLIDANLPYRFSPWHNKKFIHLFDINDSLSDSEVWEYAKTNNLTIVTKDADFSNRIILADPPPRVIHMRLGNMKLEFLHDLVTRIWKDIELMSEKNKLVTVYEHEIEGMQ
ncbi:MAG: DUF5615 family PIN-like protein [Chitinophagaceae bacterium]|nr:DUF5615 family PIN-like protein [Chitinophagaceae bacterium]